MFVLDGMLRLEFLLAEAGCFESSKFGYEQAFH